MRKIIIMIPILFIAIGPVQAEKNQNVLILPILDSNYQITRLKYKRSDFFTSQIIFGGLLGGAIDEAYKLDLNELTHYRPYTTDYELEKTVIKKMRNELVKFESVKIFGIQDPDGKTSLIRKLLIDNNLYGKKRKLSTIPVYLEILQESGFDKVVFVLNEFTKFKYGGGKYLPLHGYGTIYDMRRWGTTLSYFGATIISFDIKTKTETGKYVFSGKKVIKTSSEDSEVIRSTKLVKFLELHYGKPISELENYRFLERKPFSRTNADKVVRQFKTDFEINDDNIDQYKKLRQLVNTHAHHQFGDFNLLSDQTKALLINQSASLFIDSGIDFIGYIDLEAVDEYGN